MIQHSLPEQPVALLTGTSSGFGLLASVELAKAGFLVYATMRNPQNSAPLMERAAREGVVDRIRVLPLDVTIPETIENAVQKVKKASGHLDLLVNNAGYAQAGFVEEITYEEWKEQFETNFFGMVALIRAVIPLMREQGFGRIINMSSISGLMGFPALTPYVSSKFAMEGFSESLRYELKPLGIDVILIEPGSYQTNIWSKGKKISPVHRETPSPYTLVLQKIESILAEGEKDYGDPLEVARLIVKAAIHSRPRFRNPVGKGVRLLLLLKKFVPHSLWEKIILYKIKPD